MSSKKRTIMIFPEFANMYCINELRGKYDPLVNKVRPHITLVFPFESKLSSDEIKNILNNRLQKFNAFKIELQGLSMSNYWLSLNVTSGIDDLTNIHNALYANEFLLYKPVWLSEYVPHITVGHFGSGEELKKAYDREKALNEIFICLVDKVSVEIIGDDEESIIELEYVLPI